MAASKLELNLGDIHFSGEGTEAWVTKQLDKVLSRLQSPDNNFTPFSESNSETDAAPKQKKRGRPAKAKSAKSVVAKATGKKRGRPAKAKATASASATGKKRGRPRKSETAVDGTDGAMNGATSNGNSEIDPAMIADVLAFLTEKQATENQNRKFLATAVWLTQHGIEKLRTRDITRLLDAAGQGKLSNPSMNLNQNVDKGFCKKRGKTFTVTNAGFAALSELTDTPESTEAGNSISSTETETQPAEEQN